MASVTDPTVWRLMQATLRDAEVEQILPAKAKLMAENDGWTLVDVRPYPDYCESHAWGALNAQLYAPLEADFGDLRKLGKIAATLALFPERLGDAYAAVEENEAFLDEMQECVEWEARSSCTATREGHRRPRAETSRTARKPPASSPRTNSRREGGGPRTSSTWREGWGCGRASKTSTAERCRERTGDEPNANDPRIESWGETDRMGETDRRAETSRIRFFNHPPFIHSARLAPVYLRFVYIINGTSPPSRRRDLYSRILLCPPPYKYTVHSSSLRK